MELLGFGDGGWGWSFLSGLVVTLEVAILALPLGLFLGLMIALGRRANRAFSGWHRSATRMHSKQSRNC
jgi:ABC-type arginine transport system permease subunit